MEYVGYILVVGVIVFTLYYSFSNKITFKKGAVTSLIILFISLIFIFDEITLEGVGLLKKVKSDAIAIKKLRKELESDAYELLNLKTKLDSMFTFGSEGIKLQQTLNVGNMHMTKDGGVMTHTDMSVSSSSSEGVEMSYAFKIDGNSILIIKTESDGKGGTKNRKVEFKGNLDILNSENGVILTSSNGSKWLLRVNDSGEFYITKF